MARTDWLIVGIAVWFLVRVLGDQGGSGTSLWLTFVAMPTGIYAVTRIVGVEDRDIRWVIHAFIALGCYLAVTGILEITGRHNYVFPCYIVDEEYWQFLGRARGPLLNPVGNGILLTVAYVASLLKLIHADRSRKPLFVATTLLLATGGVCDAYA